MFLFSPALTQEDYGASTHQESFKSQRVWKLIPICLCKFVTDMLLLITLL